MSPRARSTFRVFSMLAALVAVSSSVRLRKEASSSRETGTSWTNLSPRVRSANPFSSVMRAARAGAPGAGGGPSGPGSIAGGDAHQHGPAWGWGPRLGRRSVRPGQHRRRRRASTQDELVALDVDGHLGALGVAALQKR